MSVISIQNQRNQQVKKDRQQHLEIEASIEILENTLSLLKNNNLPSLADCKKELKRTIQQLKKDRSWSVKRF